MIANATSRRFGPSGLSVRSRGDVDDVSRPLRRHCRGLLIDLTRRTNAACDSADLCAITMRQPAAFANRPPPGFTYASWRYCIGAWPEVEPLTTPERDSPTRFGSVRSSRAGLLRASAQVRHRHWRSRNAEPSMAPAAASQVATLSTNELAHARAQPRRPRRSLDSATWSKQLHRPEAQSSPARR